MTEYRIEKQHPDLGLAVCTDCGERYNPVLDLLSTSKCGGCAR